MSFTIPQLETITSENGYDAQAFPDSTDFAAITAANDSTGVVSGCAVTAKTPAAWKVAVDTGTVLIGGLVRSLTAASTLALTAASTHDRRDIVVGVVTTESLGTLYVTKTQTGTNAKFSTSSSTAATATHMAWGSGSLAVNYWIPLGLGTSLTTERGSGTGPGEFGTGHGAVLTSALGVGWFVGGTWSITLRLRANETVHIQAFRLRVGVKNGSTYTQFGSDIVLTTTTSITTTASTRMISGTLPIGDFGPTTRLYVEVWMHHGLTAVTDGIIYASVGSTDCPLTAPDTATTSVVAVKGTPCTVAGWTRTSDTLAPMKPAIPATSVLLAEVYVPGSATTVAAKNLVDKRLTTTGALVSGHIATNVTLTATTATKVFTTQSLGVGTWSVNFQVLILGAAATNADGWVVYPTTTTAKATFTGPTSSEEAKSLASSYVAVTLSTIAVVTVAGTINCEAYSAVAGTAEVNDYESKGFATGYTAWRIA